MAGRQHGCVTRQQALESGVSAKEIRRRVEKGALIRVHRGVYRVGHIAPSTAAMYMAAVLACGPGALLSHRSAAHLQRLIKGAPPPPEVITPTERRIPGVRTRRSKGTGVVVRAVPVTHPARTLIDLASSLTQPQLARAAHEASVIYGVGAPEVEQILTHRPNTKGAAILRRIVSGDVNVSLSPLESRFLSLLASVGLPRPETNILATARTVDCRWPVHNLTVELDGFKYHASRHAWERDRAREREAYARGDEFRRYTYADVIERPRSMLLELRALLTAT